MRFPCWAALGGLAALATGAAAERMLVSNSLNPCLEDSKFTASLFKLYFNPDNRSATVDLYAVSSIEGNVEFKIDVFAYGLSIVDLTVDPCKMGLNGFCPMNAGPLELPILIGPSDISQEAVNNIPSIAYDFPDLDATIRINVIDKDTQKAVACMEADISNGKTVNLVGVKWAIAIIAGLVLISSAIINGLGHTNAATHIASGALSLFGFFQTQALLGLTAVHLPPVVQSWTQDFQWSIGIVKVDFMQNIFTWYQRSTGGKPSTLFNDLTTVSVRAMKRSLPEAVEFAEGVVRRAVTILPRAASLIRRDETEAKASSYVIYGVQRVAFREGIEPTNLFITGFTSFYLFVLFTVLLVVAFKGFCELAAKAGWMKPTTFEEFRTTWTTFLRGILYRLTFLGYPSMTVLCFWELTRNDSPAEMVLAVMFLLAMTASLGWAAFKIFGITRRSIAMHRNPAYILFTDERVLNKWGFLYVQFRASAYYYIGPVLVYILVKSMFVALAQSSGITQAIGLLIIEAAALVAASVLRPWMDKSTNSFNIAICAINFINAVFLLMFADVFGQPAIVNGVIGLVLFLMNAIFALVLLLMLIITTIIIFVRKNPDSRYQFMADDRASFMKSQSQLTGTTELDALAATARGDKAGYKLDLDQDDSASITGSVRQRPNYSSNNLPLGAGGSSRNLAQPPRSPVHPSTSLLPADVGPPNPYGDSFRGQNNASPAGFRNPARSASPWQRGAGYD